MEIKNSMPICNRIITQAGLVAINETMSTADWTHFLNCVDVDFLVNSFCSILQIYYWQTPPHKKIYTSSSKPPWKWFNDDLENMRHNFVAINKNDDVSKEIYTNFLTNIRKQLNESKEKRITISLADPNIPIFGMLLISKIITDQMRLNLPLMQILLIIL